MLRGLMIRGSVVPDTDWILRDERAWWRIGERGTLRRRGPVTLIVGHWTGGHPHVGDDVAMRVVQAMRARQIEVGVHFVIGADGSVWQTADLAVATMHVGVRWANARSIGIECCWPGLKRQAESLGIEAKTVTRIVKDRRLDVVVPPRVMLESWVRLCNLIVETESQDLFVPRRVPAASDGSVLRERMLPAQLRRWHGVIEHYHVSATKVDAGSLLLEELLRSGWPGVQPR